MAGHLGNLSSETGALSNLNTRSREIFRSIVDSYLATGDPVGSRHLSRLLPISLSPASIRNVMQDLEELGLVYAPHTSAGRLPTELGLRFFVDAMLEFGAPSDEERQKIDAEVKAASAISVLVAAIAGTATGAQAQAPNDFYKGKTIEFLIGYATGGSNDTYS
ncbi:MAG: hrcA, partial [Hyphomicrobiales bacterium]|nr:hrcA [Hyphomicrobiales bacterium]